MYEESNLEFKHINKDMQEKLKVQQPKDIFYATMFLRDGFNKQTFGIELTTDAEVIPQLHNRKKWYYYSWNKNELTIRRILGTYNINKIEKMIQELLEEYKRFYMMYCKIN
jgi:hypothetical protein